LSLTTYWKRKILRPLLIFLERKDYFGEQKIRKEMRAFFDDLRRQSLDLLRAATLNDDDESQHMRNLVDYNIETHHRQFSITSLNEYMDRLPRPCANGGI
jgi:hypothetical protein